MLKPQADETPLTIDMTPTWGEWGNIYRRFAEAGESKAVRHLAQDHAKAMAAAQALMKVRGTLTKEQSELVDEVLAAELAKQGF